MEVCLSSLLLWKGQLTDDPDCCALTLPLHYYQLLPTCAWQAGPCELWSSFKGKLCLEDSHQSCQIFLQLPCHLRLFPFKLLSSLPLLCKIYVISRYVVLPALSSPVFIFTHRLSQSAWAPIMKYHRLDGSNKRHLFPPVLEVRSSPIQVLADSVSGKDPLLGC